MAKKPVPKRKGYADGGRVSENMISPDDQLGATYDRSAKTNEQTDRFLAARRAQTSANYNEMSPELQAKVLDNMRAFGVARTGSSKNPYTDKEFAQERANYPGFSKGGKVTEVRMAKRKGYNEGGYVDPNEQRLSNSSIGDSITAGFGKGMSVGKYLSDASKAKGGAVKKVFEGSKKDIRQDKAGAKKMGVSMKAYEKTPRDRAEDKAGQRQMYGKRK